MYTVHKKAFLIWLYCLWTDAQQLVSPRVMTVSSWGEESIQSRPLRGCAVHKGSAVGVKCALHPRYSQRPLSPLQIVTKLYGPFSGPSLAEALCPHYEGFLSPFRFK